MATEKALAKRTELLDSESAKEHLALAQLCEGRKQILAQYLERFYRFKGIAFEKPQYRRVKRLQGVHEAPQTRERCGGRWNTP
jgi:hypothetical protein